MLELYLDIVIKIYWIVMPILVSLSMPTRVSCKPSLPCTSHIILSSSCTARGSHRCRAMALQVVVVVARLFGGHDSKDSDTATESKLGTTHNGFSRCAPFTGPGTCSQQLRAARRG